jgi:hypothetical protein
MRAAARSRQGRQADPPRLAHRVFAQSDNCRGEHRILVSHGSGMFRYQPLAAQTAFEAAGSASSAHFIRDDPWRGRWMHLISVLARNSVLLFCDLSALLIASMPGPKLSCTNHSLSTFHYCRCFAYSLSPILPLAFTQDSVWERSRS